MAADVLCSCSSLCQLSPWLQHCADICGYTIKDGALLAHTVSVAVHCMNACLEQPATLSPCFPKALMSRRASLSQVTQKTTTSRVKPAADASLLVKRESICVCQTFMASAHCAPFCITIRCLSVGSEQEVDGDRACLAFPANAAGRALESFDSCLNLAHMRFNIH